LLGGPERPAAACRSRLWPPPKSSRFKPLSGFSEINCKKNGSPTPGVAFGPSIQNCPPDSPCSSRPELPRNRTLEMRTRDVLRTRTAFRFERYPWATAVSNRARGLSWAAGRPTEAINACHSGSISALRSPAALFLGSPACQKMRFLSRERLRIRRVKCQAANDAQFLKGTVQP
jgi:hypothetical protein